MAASIGTQVRLSMGAIGTGIASFTEAHEITSETLRKTNEIKDTNGMTGSRSHKSERTRFGLDTISGGISYAWSPLMGDLLLPRILGTTESADSFVLAETLIGFDVVIERVAKRFLYGSCYVNSAEWTFTPGEIVTCDLDIRGASEAVSATAFPSITTPVDVPFTCSDMVGTFVGSSRQCMSVKVKVDNVLNVRYSNSTTATDIFPTDRIVTVTVTTPYTSSEVDLYGQTLLGTAATIVATNGGTSTTFSFGKIQFPDMAPVAKERNGEIVFEMTGIARKTGSTMELAITHDSSP